MAASRPHEFRLLMGCGDGCDNLGRGGGALSPSGEG